MCSGPGSGASRCALRLEPMRRTVGHTAPCDRSPCVGRQEPLLRAAGAHAERQEMLVQEAGAAAPHGRSYAAGAALGAWRQEEQGDRSRCGGLQEFWPGCAGREAAAPGGRSRCCGGGRCRCAGWQVTLFATGAVAPGGKRWPNRSRCAWWQETLQRAAGAVS